jgi:homoserine kinase type II
VYRVVVETEHSRCWVLEAVPPEARDHKARISQALAFLHGNGLRAVHPHLPNDRSQRIVSHGTDHWQIRPYVDGAPLPRPDYILEGWRGRACARFLGELRETSRNMPILRDEEPFSMSGFIEEMSDTMEAYDPRVRKKLDPAFRFIENEFIGNDQGLPIVFCHGDFHPLNIIWSEDAIKSVIDWEFLGYKPQAYDVANLIGCVGFENPAGLNEGFVTELISEMSRAATVSARCWEVLPEWVVAIRFAWLSDWLRRRDEEMVDLEATYINLLIENRKALKDIWNQAA